MSNYLRQTYFTGVINPKAARILFLGFALLLPIMFSVILVFVADPAQEPAQPAAKEVVGGLTKVFTSPLDFFIVWLLFAMTFLIGMLFFVNKKYHFMALLVILGFMSIVNFYIISTTLSPTGTIDFEAGTLLAVVVALFGFAIIPTLLPFLLGGGFIYMLASFFKKPSLRQESFGSDWNQNFAKMGGLRIWRPRLFFFSLYLSVIIFVVAWLLPVTEGSTYMFVSGILLLSMGWMAMLILIQLSFNFMQGTFRTNPFSTRKHSKQKRTSRKSSIRNMRKP